MNEFRADLHTHTLFSDGTLSPADLILLAKKEKLSALSITDHDTLSAYPEALSFAEKEKIFLIPGVEFSSYHKKEPIHILGYAFPWDSGPIHDLVKRQEGIRRNRNLAMVKKIKSLFGIEIEIEKEGSFGRPHMALALIEKGVVKSMKEAFEKYLGEGKSAFVSVDRISVIEIIEEIRRGHGKAVLAHPHLIQRKRILKELLTMPFDGIEAFYAHIPRDQANHFFEIAKSKNWLITGGSDFHGENKPFNRLGSSYVQKEAFDILYNHYERARKAL